MQCLALCLVVEVRRGTDAKILDDWDSKNNNSTALSAVQFPIYEVHMFSCLY